MDLSGSGFGVGASSSPPTEITRRISSDFQEFDHYPDRGAAKYWGPILSNGGGRSFEWPEGDEEARIFVYISARHAEFQSMVHSLGARGTPFTAYIHDLYTSKIVEVETETFKVLRPPVAMDQVAAEARLVVCHGGHGTIATMLLAGKPVYVAPHHLEQALLGYRVAATGAALVANPAKRGHDYAAHISIFT